jgi:hypothetical protein
MGNFKRAIKTLVGKGTKAMYDILKGGNFHDLSISINKPSHGGDR